MKDFLRIIDHSPETLRHMIDRAADIKRDLKKGIMHHPLRDKIVALVFEKPSLRTRVSFQAGITQLGGESLFIHGSEVGLGERESAADFARVMSQYVDAIVMRVFDHRTVAEVAKFATVPVINGLSNTSHPCQAMADILTIQESFGSYERKKVVFIGDGNNVALSLAVLCGKLGMQFILSCPEGYGFPKDFEETYASSVDGAIPHEIRDPMEAASMADVLYTDVWTSMGQEKEREIRLEKFKRYQINEEMIKKAPLHVRVMHCLPAHRGEEITDGVIESPVSLVFQQAGNRMHAQKAILEWLFTEEKVY
ncbi:MAG: ornithine carbamoyltransferase [Zavarzinella sp.]